MALAEHEARDSVKRGSQDIVSGTQGCTKFRVAVQGGVDRAAEAAFRHQKRRGFTRPGAK